MKENEGKKINKWVIWKEEKTKKSTPEAAAMNG